ncbi:MAG TPA: sodium transporter [Saprospiraceae bacterium]|nr:sodium transporter [Saprospiraceae bacterium]
MNYIDLIVIVIYILGFLLLGRLFKDNKTSEDYFLGGKSFGWFPLTLSTAATQLSAISFISAPAFVGMKAGGGLKWLTFEFAVPLAMLVLMVFLVPPMYKLGIVSVYEYLEKRFDRSSRTLISIVFQISRAFGTSVMVYTVALILMSVMSIPMWQTISIIGVVTLIYSYQGGMKAVVYGDMIQMIILLLGMIACFFAGLYYLDGWDNFIAHLDSDRLVAVDFNSWGLHKGDEFGFWPMVIGGLFLYASYYGTDQSQVQRLFSAKDIKTVRKTLLANGLIRFPITLFYCIMGLIIGTFVFQTPEFLQKIPTDKPDLMIPIFIRDYLPNGIIGILIIAIFSAAMSSLSSAINSLSAASVEDIFNRNKNLTDQQYMRYSKLTALFWGVVCLILAFFTGDIAKTVIEAINKIGSVFYGPILATFIMAIGTKRVTALGANVGLLTGVALNIYLWLFVPEIFWFWWNAVGAIATFSTGIIVSLLTGVSKKSTMGENNISHLFEFDRMKATILLAYFALIVYVSMNISYVFT